MQLRAGKLSSCQSLIAISIRGSMQIQVGPPFPCSINSFSKEVLCEAQICLCEEKHIIPRTRFDSSYILDSCLSSAKRVPSRAAFCKISKAAVLYRPRRSTCTKSKKQYSHLGRVQAVLLCTALKISRHPCCYLLQLNFGPLNLGLFSPMLVLLLSASSLSRFLLSTLSRHFTLL